VLSRMARYSRGEERDVQKLGRRLSVIEPLSQHAKREGLHARYGLVSRGAVAQYAGKVRDLGNPATIVFALEFDAETQTHGPTLPRPAARGSPPEGHRLPSRARRIRGRLAALAELPDDDVAAHPCAGGHVVGFGEPAGFAHAPPGRATSRSRVKAVA
jgi:hypothetical protein